MTVQAFMLIRVILDVLIQALTDDQALNQRQRGGTRHQRKST
jgi:hypothetical protein